MLEVGDILAAGDGNCPAELAPRVCLTSGGAVKIRRALDELASYARRSFDMCGKLKDENPI